MQFNKDAKTENKNEDNRKEKQDMMLFNKQCINNPCQLICNEFVINM